ncbi:glycoside hydrolase [Chaetomium tenue]|uniref:Glycoside hydrolase n=1 Tax=Chaetomium tenue TaxID=1854479 RepID=A0ACB7PAM7_9PEZI|nr:glycoside hydrolase [Chaetomium globosum]
MVFTTMRITALSLLLGAGSVAALEVDFDSTSSVKAAAKDVAFDLMSYYKGNQSGEIPGLFTEDVTKWWTNALVWSSMIDYWRYTGDDTYNKVTVEGLIFQSGPSLRQPFIPTNYSISIANDEQGLWGMAAMQAAEVDFPSPPQVEPSWIELAKAVFDTQAARFSAEKTCGGGLRWAISPSSAIWDTKNTASTAMFLSLGARLYRFTNNETYAEWAERSWNWLTDVGLLDDELNAWDAAIDANRNCSAIVKVRSSNTAGILIQAAAYMTSQVS